MQHSSSTVAPLLERTMAVDEQLSEMRRQEERLTMENARKEEEKMLLQG